MDKVIRIVHTKDNVMIAESTNDGEEHEGLATVNAVRDREAGTTTELTDHY